MLPIVPEDSSEITISLPLTRKTYAVCITRHGWWWGQVLVRIQAGKGAKGEKKAFSFMGSLHFSCLLSRALMKGGKGLCGFSEKNIPSRRDSKNKSLKAAAALLRKTVAASGVARGLNQRKQGGSCLS